MHYINNNHFNLLIPKKTLTELLNTVVWFGIGLGGFCSDHRTDFINAQLTQDIARDIDGEVAEAGGTDGDIDGEVAVAMDIDGEVGCTSNSLESAMKLLSNVEKAIIGDKSNSHIGNCDVVSQSNPGNNGAVTFSDSIRSQIALTPSISSLPFYSDRETISDIEYDIYQSFDNKVFVTQISARELRGKLHVVISDGVVLSVNGLPSLTESWFKDQMSKVIPSHIVLRPNTQKILKLPSQRKSFGRTGRKMEHAYYVVWFGWCLGSKKRTCEESSCGACCSTTYVGGLTLEELVKSASETDCDIQLAIEITGQCKHRCDALLGNLSGNKRKQKIEEV
jgi:hypothetical protein